MASEVDLADALSKAVNTKTVLDYYNKHRFGLTYGGSQTGRMSSAFLNGLIAIGSLISRGRSSIQRGDHARTSCLCLSSDPKGQPREGGNHGGRQAARFAASSHNRDGSDISGRKSAE